MKRQKMQFPFARKTERILQQVRAKKGEGEAEFSENEQQGLPVEKGDSFVMIVSAYLVFLPVAILVLGILFGIPLLLL